MELQQRQVSPYCIKKGLQEIDDADYRETIARLAEKKYASLEGEHPLKQKLKTIQYLLQRGFEPELAQAALEGIANDPR
jgi:regulatory protein